MMRAKILRVGAALLPCLSTVGCSDNVTGAAERGGYRAPEPAPLECVPNLDGRIDASEIRPAFDTPIDYLVSPAGVSRPVDVVGDAGSGGRRRWFWNTDYSDDRVATITPRHVAGKWYADSFPPDAFVTPFDAAGRVETVNLQDDRGVWLLGLASREASPAEGTTLLVYRDPVEVLRFPVMPGSEWVSTGVVENAMLRGLPYAGRDIYEVKIDAVGTMVLPSLAFEQAHRVRTKVTVEPAVGESVSRRQVSYYFECFAEVARATSRDGEENEDFTTAAELRRIGLQR